MAHIINNSLFDTKASALDEDVNDIENTDSVGEEEWVNPCRTAEMLLREQKSVAVGLLAEASAAAAAAAGIA